MGVNKVDSEKVKAIRRMIYVREVMNIKRADKEKKKDAEMVKDIKEIIKREADKCY